MKYIQNILTICLIISVSLLGSCQSDNIDSQDGYPKTFEVDAAAEYNVDAQSPQTITFNISSYAEWQIESDQQWCVASPDSSSESSLIETITIVCDESSESEIRSARLTIANSDKNCTPIVVVVNQAAKPLLEVTDFEREFTANGESMTLTITSNQDWTIVADEWLSFDLTEGESNLLGQTITATAEPNSSLSRQTDVVIDNGSQTIILVAKQQGSVLEFVCDEGQDLHHIFSYGAESAIFDVNATMNWDVVSDNPAIVATKINDTQVEVTSTLNVFVERSATVNLIAVDGPSEGLTAQTPLMVTQESGIYLDGDAVVGSDGSLTLTKSTADNAMYFTHSALKYGTLTWTFSDVSLSEGFFDISSRTTNVGENANYQIGFGEAFAGLFGNRLRSGGTIAGVTIWADEAHFTLSNETLNAMRTLTYRVIPNPANNLMLLIEAEIDGVVVLSDTLRPDLWAQVETALGFQQEIGLIGTDSRGSMTITSCQFTPYNN